MIFIATEQSLVENEILIGNYDSPFKAYIQLQDDGSLKPYNFTPLILSSLVISISIGLITMIVFFIEKYIQDSMVLPLIKLNENINEFSDYGSPIGTPDNYTSFLAIYRFYLIKHPLITYDGENITKNSTTEDTKILEHIVNNSFSYSFKSLISCFVMLNEEEFVFNRLKQNSKLHNAFKNNTLENLLPYIKDEQEKLLINKVLNLYYTRFYINRDNNVTPNMWINFDELMLYFSTALLFKNTPTINSIQKVHDILSKDQEILTICKRGSIFSVMENLNLLSIELSKTGLNANRVSNIDLLKNDFYFYILILYNRHDIDNIIKMKADTLVNTIKESFRLVDPYNVTYMLNGTMYKKCFVMNQEIQFILEAHRKNLDPHCIYFVPKNLKYTLLTTNINLHLYNIVFVNTNSMIKSDSNMMKDLLSIADFQEIATTINELKPLDTSIGNLSSPVRII